MALALAAVGLLLGPTDVRADSKKADKLFEKGRKLMKDGEFAKACVAFQKSIDEEPSPGTYLNLGDCNTKQRKLHSAKIAFENALRLAKNDPKGTRASQIRYAKNELKKIEPGLSFLSIEILDEFAEQDDDVSLFVNGSEVAHNLIDEPIAVDIGLHLVTATINGEQEFSADVRVTDEGETVDVEVRPQPKQLPEPVEPEVFVTKRGSAKPALIVLGGAVVAASVGTALALSARSKWNEVKECQSNGCNLDQVDRGNSARRHGDLATGFFVAAGAATAVSVWLYLRRPSKQVREDESFAVGFSPRSIFVSTRF